MRLPADEARVARWSPHRRDRGCGRPRSHGVRISELGRRARWCTAPSRPHRSPVADATGGNQGSAQLICLIGDFQTQAPTWAAQESLMRMLIFLADRYGVDTDPAATTTFVSRGSDKFRAGATVTTSTISGHRDVTYTACPGDSGYARLGDWRNRVHATRLARTDPGPTKRAVRLGVHLS